jgi:mitotic spindle assembly checkpoint protein MAD1
VRELRNQNTTLNNSLQQLELQHAQLTGQHTSLTQNTNSEISLLMSRIEEIEAERDALKGWERRAKGLSIELEEEKRRAEERRRNREDQAEDRRGDEVLRKEFRRQSQQYSGYQVRISQLELEVTDLRQKKKEADVAERASKDVEWGLREEIRTLQSQLERSQREME